jgi:hypothetical protein
LFGAANFIGWHHWVLNVANSISQGSVPADLTYAKVASRSLQ